MSDFLEYKASRRKIKEEANIDINEFKTGSNKIEQHHVLSKNNSNDTIPLCKCCHDFITLKQNNLSINQRKNKFLLALKSVLSIFELGCKLLRFVIEKRIENEKGDSI